MFQDRGDRRIDLAVARRRHPGRIAGIERRRREVDCRLIDLVEQRHLEILVQRPDESSLPSRPQIAHGSTGKGRPRFRGKGSTFDVPLELPERLFGDALLRSSRRAI